MGCTYAEVAQKKDYTCLSNGFMTLNTCAENREQCVLTFESAGMRETRGISLFNNAVLNQATRTRPRFVMKGGFHKPGVGGKKRGLLVAGFIGGRFKI